MNPLSDPQLQQTLKGVFRLVAPEIALIGAACVVLLFGCFYNRRWLWFLISLVGVGIAMIVAGAAKTTMPPVVTAAPIIPDAAAAFVRWLALIALVFLLFITWPEVASTTAAEYYGCLLIASAGVSLVGRANDLITLFLALELISIPTYILLYLPARTRSNQEAAAKYFLQSVMSSAVLLFGFSYLYGLTGSTNLAVITDTLTTANAESKAAHAIPSPLALLGIVLVFAALAFRVTVVPFHFYAPDVYEGGPAGVVALVAVLPKIAGFVALARMLGQLGADTSLLPFDTYSQIPLLFWIVAILTMSLGNILALLQNDIRRMLAYSSVAHGGYMLMGIVIASSVPDSVGGIPSQGEAAPIVGGIDALLIYLVAYALMTFGAFAIILYLSQSDRPVQAIDDLAGVGQSHPVAGATMAVSLFSLIGLPLTAGFVGKFMLFLGAFTAPAHTSAMGNLYRVMAIVAAINAAIGAYYYLRVIGVMYLRTPLRPLVGSRAVPTLVAAVVLAIATIVFGLFPQPLARAARKAAPIPVLSAPTTSDAK